MADLEAAYIDYQRTRYAAGRTTTDASVYTAWASQERGMPTYVLFIDTYCELAACDVDKFDPSQPSPAARS